MKKLHRYITLISILMIVLLSSTGAILSLKPAIDHWGTAQPTNKQTASELIHLVTQNVAGVERIEKKASGKIIAHAFNQDGAQTLLVDPNNGSTSPMLTPSSFFSFTKELHRSLLLGTTGKAFAGLASLSMAMLCISGVFLLVRRFGGWKNILKPVHGSFFQTWHTELSRITAVGLIFVSCTAIYMSAASFELVPTSSHSTLDFPTNTAVGTPMQVEAMPAFRQLSLSNLREIQFPFPDDPSDVYIVKTADGFGYIDQVSGKWLGFEPNSSAQTIYETIYMLHTGQGLWWFGLGLGAICLVLIAISISGLAIWAQRQLKATKTANNTPVKSADIVIGVGSEGNATWGFANTLHEALINAGHKPHTVELNKLRSAHLHTGKFIALTSTHGDGDAPSNAAQFIQNLENFELHNDVQFAVLGFGDSGFEHFCAFADRLDNALFNKGMRQALPIIKIDKQCVQSFAKWGEKLAPMLGHGLKLEHRLNTPKTSSLTLIHREDFAIGSEEPISILKFAAQKSEGKLPKFECGDLVGIVANEHAAPRYYSLASSHKDGFLEICVKKHAHGLCSTYLHQLEIGQSVDLFIKSNATFRIRDANAPTIMVSAGTGIAPLIGMARRNQSCNPIHLYWGGRHPNRDFLYRETMHDCASDGRISDLKTAFSRIENGKYVQADIASDAIKIRSLITHGAQVMVCGGSEMAQSLRETIDQIIAPIGLNVATLKHEGRYVEDVY